MENQIKFDINKFIEDTKNEIYELKKAINYKDNTITELRHRLCDTNIKLRNIKPKEIHKRTFMFLSLLSSERMSPNIYYMNDNAFTDKLED